MNKKEVKELFEKYINNKCSAEEKKLLNNFLDSYQNKEDLWNSSILGEKDEFIKTSWSKIEAKINAENKKTYSLLPYLKYAAVVVAFLSLGYFLQQAFFLKQTELIVPNENITIELDNGNIEIIDEQGALDIVDNKGNLVGTQKGNKIVYANKLNSPVKEELVYNTLTVPYGKRFELLLSDGTAVNLNAGSSLKYPVKFIKGENRKVFLNGEAYFNVKKDTEHPFIVNSDEINVRVLGTQFNVTSYPEDKSINTVLVEGSVSIYEKDLEYNSETSNMLAPGFKAVWNKTNDDLNIEKADIEMSTAWLDGRIIFRHTSFNNIIKKLERHYNVEIINNNVALNKKNIAASFDIETIDEVFEVFKEYYGISYTINDNKIIIN
ncbi:FecR family protein [Flavivirga sp. 57AJ16]|uniref:FecR family protein n=1 Tax=Flavivirga sp. 57AJ16 TaxID=3025307 RepID=UPI0023669FB9|nr:FecR family protein [Flavivirga sp. 57AJ16]MDD7887726.1 FecR family protein [Flavivirga sp. 57AJ16]